MWTGGDHVEKALDVYGPPIYVRKQIVHNWHVVENLEERVAIFVEELNEVPGGSTVGVLRGWRVTGSSNGGQGARAESDRRDLPAGHQGSPRGKTVCQRRFPRSC